MLVMFTVVIIGAYGICFSTPYIINGPSPPVPSPSPAVYICQQSCPQKCAPDCLPTCCNALPPKPKTNYNVLSDLSPTVTETEVVYTGQAQKPDVSYSPPIPAIPASWKSPPGCGESVVDNSAAQRQSSAKPDVVISSVEEGETNECEDKGFNSPSDNTADPPGTITIPLPPTMYTPPRPGEEPQELPLPEFHLPASIFQGKFPQQSLTLTPVDKTKASPIMTPSPLPPQPSPPPPSIAAAPVYPLLYPKLPPVTVSEIPVKKKPLPLPLVTPPQVLLKPPPIQIATIAPIHQSTPLTFSSSAPASVQTSSNVLSAQSVVPPPVVVAAHNKASVQPPCEASKQPNIAAEVTAPVIIDTSCDTRCEDPEEYECMVKEMKEALDTRYPEIPKRREVVKPTG